MEWIELAADLRVARTEGEMIVVGELTADNAALLEQWVARSPVCHTLQLGDLDIVDGVACTHAVNVVRLLLARSAGLVIAEAPQVLAHNLYRTGLLAQGNVQLLAMREDEAYG